LRNNLAYATNGHALTADMGNGGPIDDKFNSWDASLNVKVSDADFQSVAFKGAASCPPDDLTCFAGMASARQADGSLPVVPFLRLANTSPLIDKGTDVGLPFAGKAPDLGAFESGMATPPSSGGAAGTATGGAGGGGAGGGHASGGAMGVGGRGGTPPGPGTGGTPGSGGTPGVGSGGSGSGGTSTGGRSAVEGSGGTATGGAVSGGGGTTGTGGASGSGGATGGAGASAGDGGCACHVAGGARGELSALALLAFSLLARVRRRPR